MAELVLGGWLLVVGIVAWLCGELFANACRLFEGWERRRGRG